MRFAFYEAPIGSCVKDELEGRQTQSRENYLKLIVRTQVRQDEGLN